MSGKTPVFTASCKEDARASHSYSAPALFDIGVLCAAAESSRPRTGWAGGGGGRGRRRGKESKEKIRGSSTAGLCRGTRSLNAGIFFFSFLKQVFFPRLIIPSVIIADPCREFQ